MPGLRLSLAAALACATTFALPAAASAATCAGADTTITAGNLSEARAAILCIVNAERTARGLDALTRSENLEVAAQLHSEDMLARDYFSHTAPAPAPFGASPGARITAAGYDWNSYGENIAAGYRTPRAVMLGWMKSAGHCRNILAPGFTQLGVGVTALAATLSGGSGTWTQNFGRPDGVSSPSSDDGPQGGCPYATLTDIDSGSSGGSGGGSDGGTPSTPTTPGGSGGSAGLPSTPVGTTPAPGAPGEATPATPALLDVVLRHIGRRLTVAGTLLAPNRTVVRITVKQGARVIWSGRTRLRKGAFRVTLRGRRNARNFTVVVRAAGQRVTRTIA